MTRLVVLVWALMLAPAASVLAQTAQTPDTPSTVDLRPAFEKLKLPIRRQGARGTCSVFTVTGALEFVVSRKLKRTVLLSPEYLNWAANQVTNNPNGDGHFFSHLWQGYERLGICEESQMPYARSLDPANQPSADAGRTAERIRRMGLTMYWIRPNDGTQGVTDGHLAYVKEVLRAGWPVCAGSYHSLLFVGYADDPAKPGGGEFVLRDSASGREGRMSYEEAKGRLCDLLYIEPKGAKPIKPGS